MARKPGRFALLFIFLTVMLNMIGLGVIMPVMPNLIMDVTGDDLSHAAKWGGYLTLVYALMQFMMMPVIGGLSDHFGRRPILLISMAAYSFDFLVMALAPVIGVILVARFLAGAFAATFSTANAYIADISPPEKRAANFGLVGAAFGLGFIIGPAIGGFLGEQFGPRAPFFFVAFLGAANFTLGYFVLPETLAPENRRPFDLKRANAFGSFKQFARYPIMLPIAGVLFLSQLAHWAYPSIWSYYALEKFDWTPGAVAASLSFVGLTAAIVQGGLTRIIIPKIGERASAILAMSVTMVAYVAFAFVTKGWMVYAVIAFSALGGLAQPALQGIMSRTMPANAQGELQGAIAAVMSISMVISPWMMTQMFSAFIEPGTPFKLFNITIFADGAPFYFPGAPFIFSSVLEIGALIMLFAAFRHITRPREEKATD
ncbi:MAG: TCR/Tet family MFS transporter [Alphaproteobacteria bacterium]|nr:TCR/Tet family MFS transporter [Alphaproteobacteria bacterium]